MDEGPRQAPDDPARDLTGSRSTAAPGLATACPEPRQRARWSSLPMPDAAIAPRPLPPVHPPIAKAALVSTSACRSERDGLSRPPMFRADSQSFEREGPLDVLDEAVESLKDSAPGYVSLEGIWGSGKSSVVTLARSRFEERGRVTATFAGARGAIAVRLGSLHAGDVTSTVTLH